MTKEHDADTVGFKNPPKRHQFQPGQSGNPNGRPKGTRNFKTDLREELSEIISFREADHDVSISKQRALIKRLVASAINGDARASKLPCVWPVHNIKSYETNHHNSTN
jgi:hypothetical protein